MTDIFRVLGWLNAIDNCSYLTKEDRQLIGAIGKFGLFDFRVEPILERLQGAARSSSDLFRKAEILLWCAAIGHSRGWCPQAARDAKEALTSYGIDNHRRAVAHWILGIMQWEMLQNHDAYENWSAAKNIFKRCQSLCQSSTRKKDWYRDSIWQMEIELVARPEEIASWLNYFEASSLGAAAGRVVHRVRKRMIEQAYSSIYDLMRDLQEANSSSKSLYERAEVDLEFGLATYQIGNSNVAIDLLREAVKNFYPGIGCYHKQEVARCMLGALEWMHKSSGNQAAEHWMHSIDQFENLRWCADRDNLPQKEEWYSEHRDILRSALLERVKPPKQTPDRNLPKESKPTPPQSPPR